MVKKSKRTLKIIVYLTTILSILGLGIISMALPFLPIGWILIFCALLLLLPYFPSFKSWSTKLEEKDGSNTTKKIKGYVEYFYCWAHDEESMDC